MSAGEGTGKALISAKRRRRARVLLVLLCSSPVLTTCLIHVHNSQRVAPIPISTHNLGGIIALLCLWIALACVAVVIMGVTVMIVGTTIQWLWRESFREYNTTLWSEYKTCFASEEEETKPTKAAAYQQRARRQVQG